MTYKRAYDIISEFCFTGYKDNKKPTGELFSAIHELVCEVEESTKLKAEIEQLKHQIETRIKVSEANFNIYSKLEIERDDLVAEIEQLKSELEQSVIPCIHGYDKKQNAIGETLIFCEHTDNWMNVTLGECVGNCEAEQSLRGTGVK